MKKPKIDNTKLLYQLISLLFALLLFFYVNYQRIGSTRTSDKNQAPATLMTNRTVRMSMPLTLNVDNDKYFVTGYPEKVKVSLSGPSAMVKAMDNTRSFEVYADLSKLAPGTHTVKFRTAGLNREVNATIEPASAEIRIERRKTITMPVQARFDTGQLASGYAAGTPELGTRTVSVTGGRKAVGRIARVVANVNLPDGTNSTYSRTVPLQAVDSSGNAIEDVVISPAVVHVTVPVGQATSTKTVPLLLEAGDGGVDGKSYSFTSPTRMITLHGTRTALKSISSYRLKIPVVGVDSTTTKTVRISPTESGITSVSPTSIQVTVMVQQTGSQTQESASTGSDKQTTKDDSDGDDDKGASSSTETSSSSSSSATDNDN